MIPRLTLFFALAASAAAAGPRLKAGQYDNLLLAVENGHVTGSFLDALGSGPSCAFALDGKEQDGATPVTAYWPGQPKTNWQGRLRQVDDSTIELRFTGEQPGGCAMAHNFDLEESTTFGLREPHPEWKEVRDIKAAKVHFSSKPKAGAERRAYLVEGDTVAVSEITGGWRMAHYDASGKPVSGWLPESAFYPLRP